MVVGVALDEYDPERVGLTEVGDSSVDVFRVQEVVTNSESFPKVRGLSSISEARVASSWNWSYVDLR